MVATCFDGLVQPPTAPPGALHPVASKIPFCKTPTKKRKKGVGYLGGGFKHFLFSPLPGEMIQFD